MNKQKLFEIVFEADTKPGKAFDIVLLIMIVFSLVLVMLESVKELEAEYRNIIIISEWVITIFFSIEYILRLIISPKPLKYAFSFFGIIDLLAIIPSFFALFSTGVRTFSVLRSLRLLRMFRVLKLTRHIQGGNVMIKALKASQQKISVFLFSVIMVVIIVGAIMYTIEGEENGFTSIPRSIYWAIVTLTTVGYGDISPQTDFGQFISSLVMIIGYSIIAVPTGIISGEMSNIEKNKKYSTQVCPKCMAEGHDYDAVCCKHCGAKLNE
ncbi:MAG: ion transporter [Ichthyobacteriaceae bacterium]|nr:ion transporter [Ichthyobacteriaceae bacterium]